MNDSTVRIAWTAPATSKARNAVHRSVVALLNELAPERIVKRVSPASLRIERQRMPISCVLQAPNAAVSVSWFAAALSDTKLGELQIIVWRGIVSQRGPDQNSNRATVVSELLLLPVERGADDSIWEAADGTQYDTASLAARCNALLDEEMQGKEG